MRVAALLLLFVGCGSTDNGAATAPCQANYVAQQGSCVPRFDVCASTQVPVLGGGCADVGVPAALCPDGGANDGKGGCVVPLPTDPCPAGTMALVGDAACRPVADCGTDRFPVATGAVTYVDESFTGGGSDGTAARPHTTIGAAVAAAPTSATIAIAAGTYRESLSLSRAVTLVGVCPSKTEIAGGTAAEVVSVRAAVKISGLAVTGGTNGIVVRSGPGATLDHVWLHDIGNLSLDARANEATTIVRDSRVEADAKSGALGASAGKLVIERTHVRMVPPLPGATRYGIVAGVGSSPTKPTELVVSHVVIDQVAASGPFLFSQSNVSLDSVVVRGVGPVAPTTRESAIYVKGGSTFGGSLKLRRTVLDRPFGTPLSVDTGAKAEIEGLVVRAREGSTGRVLGAEATVRSSLFEGGSGLLVSTGTTQPVRLALDHVIIRDGTDSDVAAGVRCSRPREVDAIVRVDTSRVEAMFTAGISSHGCNLEVTGSLVRAMRASGGKFGDGIAAFADWDAVPATVSVVQSYVEGNVRAGMLLAASRGTIRDSLFSCNGFDLDVERIYVRSGAGTREGPFQLEDGGGNACGCKGALLPCKAQTAALDPIPASVGPG